MLQYGCKKSRVVGRAIVVVAVTMTLGWAGDSYTKPKSRPKRSVVPVDVAVGGSRLVRFRGTVSRFVVANPKVADAKQSDTRSIQILGNHFGETTILVWDGRSTPTRLVVTVSLPTEGLTARLKAVFPDESITAEGVGDAVVLKGAVSDPVVADRVAKLAKAFLSGGKNKAKVLNFLDVSGRQQVQIRVKVAEVSRDALRRVGMNLFMQQHNKEKGTGINGVIATPSTPFTSNSLFDATSSSSSTSTSDSSTTDTSDTSDTSTTDSTSSAAPVIQAISSPLAENAFGLHFGGLFGSGDSVLALSAAISLLQGHGLAKILSEPTLVAYSGQPAEFLAGGEIPFTVSQSALTANTIEYKPYGVQLRFTPTVLGSRTIHLKVGVTVSDVDETTASANAPRLNTRQSQTTVRLRNGQSFAIAGLLEDKIVSSSRKIPLLGDIPILGMFFSERRFSRQERELVILVTANLVRPLHPGEVPALPGEDEVSDAGAFAFFMLGAVDPELKGKPRSQPAGPVGYSK